jgi:hypothetical protein
MVWCGMWAAPAIVYYPNGPLSPRLVPVPVHYFWDLHGRHATQSSDGALLGFGGPPELFSVAPAWAERGWGLGRRDRPAELRVQVLAGSWRPYVSSE